MIDLNKIDFEEIAVNDQYIDDMMEHFGFTWNEPNMEYIKGDETVSGDFASNMAKLKNITRRINNGNLSMP